MHNLLLHSVPLLMLASGGIMYVAAKTEPEKSLGKRAAWGSIGSAVGTFLLLWIGWPTVAMVWGGMGLLGLGVFWYEYATGTAPVDTLLATGA